MIVGPNATGKTNILEAIYALATGKSFRADTELEVIKENSDFASIKTDNLEILFDNRERFTKTYRVNGVGKRQQDFVGNLRAVLFCPQDIEIVTDGPSIRRHYLDLVLSQIFKDYRLAISIYEKALRQRNKLLWRIREENLPHDQLSYWDDLLINNGKVIHEKRRDYLKFLGVQYDHSIISAERLEKYAHEEIASATTLVGPHRDDFLVPCHPELVSGSRPETEGSKNQMLKQVQHDIRPVKNYGSRGEQRLAIFNIKLKELEYVEKITGEKPILLLDDIFSELDHKNRHKILEIIPKQQTIMTTTDLHLIEKTHLKDFQLITL